MKKEHKLYIYCSLGILVIAVFVCIILLIQRNEFTDDNISQKKRMEKKKNDIVDIVKSQEETVIVKSGEKLIYGKEQWENFLDNTKQDQKSHIMLCFTEDEINIRDYIDLSYNGEYFIISKEETEETKQYKYIYNFEFGKEIQYKTYILMDEEDMTFDKFVRKNADAILQNIPDSYVLFTVEK